MCPMLRVLCAASCALALALPHHGQDPSTLDLASLAVEADDAASRLALAIGLAADGASRAAVAELERVAQLELDRALAERVALERERALAWISVRDLYLTDLARKNGSLRIEWKGDKLVADVVAFEGGVVRLAANERGVEEIAVEDVPPLDLIARIGSQVDEYGPPWVRLYPYALVGDEKVGVLMRRDPSREVEQLRADAASFYRETLARGRALAALDRLAQSEPPRDAADARRLYRLVERAQGARELEALRERAPVLRELAQLCLDLRFAADGLPVVLRGDVESLGEGRVRLTYDFEDERELDDFARDDHFLAAHHTQVPKLSTNDTSVHVEEGALHAWGAAALRHVLELEGQTAVLAEVRWSERPTGRGKLPILRLGCAADRGGNYVLLSGLGDLFVQSGLPRFQQNVPARDTQTILVGRDYVLELRHDGTSEASSWVDKGRQARIDCGPRTHGLVFLWFHSDLDVRIDELVIEGRPRPASLDALRKRWVASELAQLGLS